MGNYRNTGTTTGSGSLSSCHSACCNNVLRLRLTELEVPSGYRDAKNHQRAPLLRHITGPNQICSRDVLRLGLNRTTCFCSAYNWPIIACVRLQPTE
jgi:hypothetical protein